jgi:hypothetical protein
MNINAGWRLTQLLFVLSISQTAQVAFAENDAIRSERLTGKIDYSYVGHLGETDDKGRSLVWEATIEGGLNGTIKWWFVNPPPASGTPYTDGRLTFYAARWEFWVDEKLLLAGESAGKTDFRNGADGIWDGHGRVTEAYEKFRSLKGHAVYETGSVILGSDPPRSFSGTGMFQIY